MKEPLRTSVETSELEEEGSNYDDRLISQGGNRREETGSGMDAAI